MRQCVLAKFECFKTLVKNLSHYASFVIVRILYVSRKREVVSRKKKNVYVLVTRASASHFS